jgi:Cu-Zn family superoxide dismutase
MKWLQILGLTLFTTAAFASTTTVKMFNTAKTGQGSSVGTVTFTDTKMGLLIQPHLIQLPPGMHGFHIHVGNSCSDMGMAAMGHLDPKNTGKHLGPYDANGHLGDLPALYVDNNGTADTPILAPQLTVKDIEHHTVMVHAGGDNYSDTPEKLGGGGARVACGVIN